MKKLLIILGLVLIFFSCNRTEKSDNQIHINITPVKQSVKLSEVVEIDSIKKIKFNSFKKFGGIKKTFLLSDNKILAHTINQSSLSIINKNGIVEKQYIPDFKLSQITSVSFFDDLIYVLDRTSMEVHLFTKNLDYKNKIAISFFAQSLQVLSKDLIAFYVGNEMDNNTGRLLVYDISSQKIIKDLLEISKNQKRYFNFMTNYNFFVKNNNPYFWNSPQNEIVKISRKGQLSKSFFMNYGDLGVPKGFYEQAGYSNPFEFIKDTRRRGYSHRHFKMLANDNFLLAHYDHADDTGSVIFNFKSNKSISFEGIMDDFWQNKAMDDIILSFFVDLYQTNQFVGYVPFEYFQQEDSLGIPSDYSDCLVFGRLIL